MSDPASFQQLCRDAGVHTVEVAAPDTQGHLRGKRVPVDRFFATTVDKGASIADAIFVFDMQNDLFENDVVNFDTGFSDCTLVPDVATGRILTHRPGYALAFADALDHHGEHHGLAPRSILAAQIDRCRTLGLEPVVATEMEFYLCNRDLTPIQDHIQYSSLTDNLRAEAALADMRSALAGAGLEVEGSNAEYGPAQYELNIGHADAMTTADNTVLMKSIVKHVAESHDMVATFMPKPWAEQSGSGMHVHTSLVADGENAFASADGAPNPLMAMWIAGLLEHAQALTLLGAPTTNGTKRIRPYTFAPTHVHWGLDNRTVLARCIAEAGSAANRVEFRSAGADANPYLIIAGVLAAGSDGVERELTPPMMCTGDMYTEPGDSPALPTDLAGAIEAYEDSAVAEQLGDMFSRTYLSLARHELALAAEHSPDADDVNDWDRARYAIHC